MFSKRLCDNNYCFRIISCITASALVFATALPVSAADSYCDEMFVSKGLNKEIEKLLEPIYALNEKSSLDDIAKEAAKFKTKLFN